MRLFYWLYMNLKLVFKQFPMTILYMVGLPLGIGLLIGSMTDILFENPNAIDPIKIEIIDEDQSTLSGQLIDFLNSEAMNAYLNLSTESPNATLTIPTEYEEQLLASSGGSLTLNEVDLNNVTVSLEMVQGILNQYHEQLMVNLSPDDSDSLVLIYEQPSLQSTYIETPLQLNSITFYSVGMMGFMIFMLIMTVTAAGYKSSEMGLEKRYYTAPLTRLRMFNYDFIANWIYCFLLLIIYVLFYRWIGYSFSGPLWLLIAPVLVTSFFIVSVGAFIGNFFSAKYGNAVATILFFVQLIFGQTFVPTESLANLSPTYFITEMFQNYILQGTWASIQNPLLITLVISFILYGITCLKEKYRFWEV